MTGLGLLAVALGLAAMTPDSKAAHLGLQIVRTEAGSLLMQVQASPGFRVSDASGPAGQPMPIRVKLPENATASYSFLMFRNLPPDFRLSAGFGTKTYWAVSLQDVEGLQILPSDNFSGAFTLEVLLIKTMGSDPERAAVSIEFQSPGTRVLTSTPPDSTAALPDPNAIVVRPQQSGSGAPSPQPRLVEPARRAAPMTPSDQTQMDRGDAYLRQGDVASARLIYRQLARRDIVEGVFAMASTYDPDYLGTLGVRGLKPDLDEAKKWYAKAQSLGSPLAARRLTQLNEQSR